MNELTEREAYNKAYDSMEYDLTDLINPSDVIDGANRWSEISDETLQEEAYECVEHGDLNHEQENVVFDRTFTLVKESLTRVICSDVIEHLHERYTVEELVSRGIWTGDMSYSDLWEVIHDIEPWNHNKGASNLERVWMDCNQEATYTVESAYADYINPRQSKRL